MPDNETTPRCPILFCHGLLGFGSLRFPFKTHLDYWRKIPEFFQTRGWQTAVAEVHWTAPVTRRAPELACFIERFPGRVHLIAHSMGGLDARYCISRMGLADKVATLTTLGTPHRGTLFANWLLEKESLTARALQWVGNATDASETIRQLTLEAMNVFNQETPDAPDVSYFCRNGTLPPLKMSPLLQFAGHLQQEMLREFQSSGRATNILTPDWAENDGLVPLPSAQWGTSLGTVSGDHFNLINWRLNEFYAPLAPLETFYGVIASRLLAWEFDRML